MEDLLKPHSVRRTTQFPLGVGYTKLGNAAPTSFSNNVGPDYHRELANRTSKDNNWFALRKAARSNSVYKHFVSKMDIGNGSFSISRTTREPHYIDHFSRYDELVGNLRVQSQYDGPIYIGLSDLLMRNLVTQNMYVPSVEEIHDRILGPGATALSLTNPLKSQNQLVVSLIELYREGIPKMVGIKGLMDIMSGRSRNVAREGGSEFLNYQFGWVPLISDIMSLAETSLKIDKILRDLEDFRNSEKRRRFEFDPQFVNDSFRRGRLTSATPNMTWGFQGRNVTADPLIVRQMSTKTWFSGAFRFYSPDLSPTTDYLRDIRTKAAHLLGLRLTPDTIWELTPWSWLIDYFANIGNVLSNISYIGNDGLVLRYGYIMQSVELTADVSLPGIKPLGGAVDVQEQVTLVRKVRRRALPYGFSLKAEDFSPQQWAILGALGMARSPRSLF